MQVAPHVEKGILMMTRDTCQALLHLRVWPSLHHAHGMCTTLPLHSLHSWQKLPACKRFEFICLACLRCPSHIAKPPDWLQHTVRIGCTALLDNTCTSGMSCHACSGSSEIALACAAHVLRNMPHLLMLLWDSGLGEARSWESA